MDTDFTEGNEACAREAGLNVGASPARRIGLFTTEHDLNSVAVRRGWKLREMEQTSRNESEPHLMSLETSQTRDKPSLSLLGEGRWGRVGQQPALAQRSGGVRVDSASGRQVRVTWEDSGDGR